MDKPLPAEVTSYDDAVRWIYGRINYERVRPRTSSGHFRLDRIRHLLALIGSPQERIPAVHIAGTKGKGSTAAMLDSIVRATEIRSGLFTSPHIELFEERMRVDGRPPQPDQLTSLVRDLKQRLQTADADLVEDGPTYFEVATLLAWMYFDRCQVELVVLETGLGGRLDCTNVCQPLVTVITNIGLDHTHVLGDTIEKIAAEKAGILKPGIPLITGVTQPAVIDLCESRARELNAPVTRLHRDIRIHVSESAHINARPVFTVTTPQRTHSNLTIPLHGAHQIDNAALAIAAADVLGKDRFAITPATIRSGAQATKWPLRFEVVCEGPTIILDAGHNPDAAMAIVTTLRDRRWTGHPRVLIFAASRDKDAEGMLRRLMPEFDYVILTRFETNPRCRNPDDLLTLVRSVAATGIASETAATPASALARATELAGTAGLICGTGSIFLASELRCFLR